ncbi:class I SAM-dependent methyltransferase [Metabacillus sp. RGM 3146]|uniref:class I SAM-dependent methyltransferase n=1 Tax=Metabacillus sp. RGM 3146 TaxID=3401092 RepID=UPI003B9C1FA5
MIVTTGGRTDSTTVISARRIAEEIGGTFVERRKQPLSVMKLKFGEQIVVLGRNRMECHFPHKEEPLFFHPNSAMFRVKRLLRNEKDPFAEALGLMEGKTVLDCTMGLGSDSIVASYIVGNKGKVIGLEGDAMISYLVKTGLASYQSGLKQLDESMKRIKVIHTDHLDYLKNCRTNEFDVIFFDPMFEEEIEEASNFSPLKSLALYSPLTKEAIHEAKRAAKEKVVLKDHWKSSRFEELGFRQIKRKSSKFHYGVIEMSEGAKTISGGG